MAPSASSNCRVRAIRGEGGRAEVSVVTCTELQPLLSEVPTRRRGIPIPSDLRIASTIQVVCRVFPNVRWFVELRTAQSHGSDIR